MPLDHKKATASISVTGLALGCYNPETSNWEVAFLRHERHVLNVVVTKQTEVGPSEIRFQVDSNHDIFVEAEKPIIQPDPLFTPTAKFDRLADGNDPEDLRWIVDMEKELNEGKSVELKPSEVPVTRMFVSYPKLYANSRMFITDETKLVKDDNTPVREFGKLAEAANADISCQDGGAVILRIDGPLGFNLRLPHIPGSPHSIAINNRCPDPPMLAAPESDFKLYYSIIKDTAGEKFDLKVRTNGHGDGAVCNKVFLGVRDHLFPLPQEDLAIERNGVAQAPQAQLVIHGVITVNIRKD